MEIIQSIISFYLIKSHSIFLLITKMLPFLFIINIWLLLLYWKQFKITLTLFLIWILLFIYFLVRFKLKLMGGYDFAGYEFWAIWLWLFWMFVFWMFIILIFFIYEWWIFTLYNLLKIPINNWQKTIIYILSIPLLVCIILCLKYIFA